MTAATDLLEKMLELDVDKRLTASQALAHPFFEPFRDPEEETEAQQPLDDSLEREKLTLDEWKRKGRAPQRLPRSLQPLSPLLALFPRLASAALAFLLETMASFSLSKHCLLRALLPALHHVYWGREAGACPQHPLLPNPPAFLRAHLQGDRELQPHCPEGLSAPEWHEAAVRPFWPDPQLSPGMASWYHLPGTAPGTNIYLSLLKSQPVLDYSLPSRGWRAPCLV